MRALAAAALFVLAGCDVCIPNWDPWTIPIGPHDPARLTLDPIDWYGVEFTLDGATYPDGLGSLSFEAQAMERLGQVDVERPTLPPQLTWGGTGGTLWTALPSGFLSASQASNRATLSAKKPKEAPPVRLLVTARSPKSEYRFYWDLY